MNSQVLWNLFRETGSPELYILFSNARKMEKANALKDSSAGAAGRELQ